MNRDGGTLILVSGGSASGKSEFAEGLAVAGGPAPRYYIATMQVFDAESERRVARHRAMRADKGFVTLERQTNLAGLRLPQAGRPALLECMSNLTANEMYREDGAGDQTCGAVCRGISALAERAGNLVVVTNEVFSDGIVYDPETERYLEYLGQINQYLAQIADCVTEVVYGIPVCVKGMRR